jgi:protein-S-isoprenylcysteine O-methyltransferase Ste14
VTAVLFSSALLLELVYVVLFALTIVRPHFRFWPPPSHRSWQFFGAWVMAGIVAVLFLLLGLLDYESFVLPRYWLRVPFALLFLLPGGLIGSWASVSFPLRATIGLGGRLIRGGPYRYSRNPQYLGDSLCILGYIVLTNSWMVAVLGVVLNLVAPFTEEPWLEERFGDPYREYKRRVPRFIGRRSENLGA